ncbi:MAG TPA: hypothetical protein VJ111_04945 [Chitinophagaceae bacterium]|nr:hypothetical protein [Chitinophagaceae bacterium]
MNRRNFISLTAGILAANHFMTNKMPEPERLYFKDDGKIPNSKYPLLLYRNAFKERGDNGAAWLEQHFLQNNWSNSWRNGIFDFHHYHSITHEALGIYSGSALVHLGGEEGSKVKIQAGDIIVIPAGVGHKNLASEDLGVVGAYPDGMQYDLMREKPGERPQADENIAAVPIPAQDPLMGKNNGLLKIWK